ncbi:helix-turn-helix transcriptional regulator [Clostridium estertheticum]|uniref:helix-turn-helix transcriptional regulator n=1 Tax=Clostridium estertheticum TaxID=238834 RepID=UPI001C0D5147|nr:helix-turn-helix domain-containing protein [Clostridium estertheticum]MBU3173385.1 helix-turn-helix domain-containing protein [Clostridium estertheticum]
MTIKNKLREIRMREYMLSQKDFCEVLKINVRTYSPLENNKVQGNIETIFFICKNLHKKIEDIWYEVSE